MEISLNVLLYCVYNIHYNLHLSFNKINPANLIQKIPFVKRRYKQLGINIESEINKAFADKKDGISISVSGGVLLAVLFVVQFTAVNFFNRFANNHTILSGGYFVTFGIISLMLGYFFMFRKDKYLIYFSQFEKWTQSKRRKYNWLSFLFILIIVIVFFVSL